jgi:multiple sugar transport system substrate-binding protein
MNRHSVSSRLVSRRGFLRSTGVAAGAIAASSTFAAPVVLRASAQETADVSGRLVEWGFGIQETNPLARARVLAFEDAFPSVELEIVESFDEQKLLTAAASDTLPDVIWLGRFETATWASRGILQPLTDFIARDSYDTSAFYPFAIEEATWEDEIYGIPGGADVRGLYVNVDQLTEAGGDIESLDTSDWDQLSELGAQLVQASGDQVERWGFDHRVQANNFWLWGRGNGGHFMNDDATESTFNDEKNVEAMDWAVKAYEAQGGSNLYDALATTFQGDEQFARGIVAMSVYEQWMLSAAIATVDPDLNFRLLPIRERNSGPDGKITTFSGGNGWYITNNAQNPVAAWEFIKFLHTDETWRIGAEAVKALRQENNNPYFPSLTGKSAVDQMQIDELYEPVGPSFDEAVALLPQLVEASESREISKSPVAGQLEDVMLADGIKPALSGSASPQDALDTANQNAQDAIDSF